MCDDHLSPSAAYLNHTRAQVARKVAAFQAANAESGPAYEGQQDLWDAVVRSVDKHTPALLELGRDLYAHPETAFEEYRSRDVIAELLCPYDPQIAVHGVETALRAERGHGGPTIAVMAEYDALPGLGHACGHNLIAAAGVGAFMAATDVLAQHALPGRIVLLGTPAEEGHSGKEYMIRGGMLDGVDAAVMMHPFSYDIASHAWVGRRVISARFRGVSAHASSQPFMGRNALDAATLAYQGIGLMRQQMPPSDRVHAVITEGGHRPSVIPSEAEMAIYVRSALPDALRDLSHRIEDILEGAARMAGVAVDITWDVHPPSLPIRNNQALAARWTRTQAQRGRTSLPGGIVPETLAASTDFGNVSYLVPGIHPMVKIAPEDVALHTAEFERWSRSPEADAAVVDAAIGLAQVVVDLVADDTLLAQAQAEFEADGGAISVASYFA